MRPTVEQASLPTPLPFRNSLSGVQLVEQGLGLLQIERVEAFGEPAIDRSEQFANPLRFP